MHSHDTIIFSYSKPSKTMHIFLPIIIFMIIQPILSDTKEGFWAAGLVMQNCWNKISPEDNQVSGLVKCLKKKSLILLDAIVEQDELELPLNLRLVKLDRNETVKTIKRENSKYQMTYEDWGTEVIKKFGHMLNTHSLKIPLSNITINTIEARRRRGNNIMPLMLFGIMAMAIISIPLGFQFLAVLGGKSLLLAKLALILTSIQGLKRIATSNLNYGLYHTHRNDYKPWLYDRRGQPPVPDHHGYQGFDVPDQREDALYHHLSPRISHVQQMKK